MLHRAQNPDEERKRVEKERAALHFSRRREVGAVASSFGALFRRRPAAGGGAKREKFHWYTPVRASEHYLQAPDEGNARGRGAGEGDLAGNPVRQQRLRRQRSVELFDRHQALSRSVETAGHLLPSSLFDVPREGQPSPFAPSTSKVIIA